MKKVIALLALSLASLSVMAQGWVLVDETKDGQRLLVKKGSITTGVNKNSSPWVGGDFAITNNGEIAAQFYMVTLVQTCVDGGGELIAGVDENTRRKYWWSQNGDKMYDTAGRLLCAWLEAELKSRRNTVPPAPPIQSTPSYRRDV